MLPRTSSDSGFTLVELLVSVSIFVFMTAFLIGKYGTYNQSVVVTNTAYDVALTIRSAQSYGLNVKGGVGAAANVFTHAFGAHFVPNTSVFYMFNDLNDDSLWTANETISTSTMRNGVIVSKMCTTETDCSGSVASASLDVTFKRPNPDAIIIADSNSLSKKSYVQITIRATDGTTKNIVVRGTGQIAITN